MNYDLILIGGGRDKDTSNVINDIYSVLSKDYLVGKIWIDNHGCMWLDNEEGERVVLTANRIIPLGNNEMIIGGDEVRSYKVGKVWSVCKCENMIESGIHSILEFGGFESVGSGSMMNAICTDLEMSKLIFKGLNFSNNKKLKIAIKEWENNHLEIEDKIGRDFGFPVEIRYADQLEKVSIFENFSNIVFRIFEEGANEVEVIEAKNIKCKYVIGFVGGRNFLPSKIGEIKNNNVEIAENRDLERELQNFVIDFVKTFDVKDMGMIYIDKGIFDWKVSKIELMPDLSIDGVFARLWNLSGLNYSTMINKIFDESGD